LITSWEKVSAEHRQYLSAIAMDPEFLSLFDRLGLSLERIARHQLARRRFPPGPPKNENMRALAFGTALALGSAGVPLSKMREGIFEQTVRVLLTAIDGKSPTDLYDVISDAMDRYLQVQDAPTPPTPWADFENVFLVEQPPKSDPPG
jgi:hypothetical protein